MNIYTANTVTITEHVQKRLQRALNNKKNKKKHKYVTIENKKSMN